MKYWNIDEYGHFFEEIIKTEEKELNNLLKEKDKLYISSHEIPKKNGRRNIYELDKNSKLYRIQKRITGNFINNIMLSECCYGFKKGCNYIDFLEPHIKFFEERYYIRLDIKNFFESIGYDFLRETIAYYIKENEKVDKKQKVKLINYIMEIVTYKKKVVQGAITSPAISNVVFRQLDIRIERYCRKLNIEYSRYADDLLFSSPNKIVHSKGFLSKINKIILDKDFNLNYSKIKRGIGEISLNGYVIGDSIRISRKKLEQVSRVLFYVENTKINNNKKEEYINGLNDKIASEAKDNMVKFSGIYSLVNYLTGNRAFLICIFRYIDDKKNKEKVKKIIIRLEGVILKLA